MNKDTGLRLRTVQEAEWARKIFLDKGWEWEGQSSFPNAFWETYKDQTCVDLGESFGFADVNYYERGNCEIISLDAFCAAVGEEKLSSKVEFTIEQLEAKLGFGIVIVEGK